MNASFKRKILFYTITKTYACKTCQPPQKCKCLSVFLMYDGGFLHIKKHGVFFGCMNRH